MTKRASSLSNNQSELLHHHHQKKNYLDNSLKGLKNASETKNKPFKIPDSKVLVNKKLLWTYEMDKKLLDLYNKNGAHWLLISTVMERTVGCGDNYFNTISVKQRVEYLLTQLNKNSADTKKKQLKEPDFYSFLYETSKFNGVSPNPVQTRILDKENIGPPPKKVQRTSQKFRIESTNSSKPLRLVEKNGVNQIQPLSDRPIMTSAVVKKEEEPSNENALLEDDFFLSSLNEIECSDNQIHFSNSTGSSSPLELEHQQNPHRSKNDLFDFDCELEQRLMSSESLFADNNEEKAELTIAKTTPKSTIPIMPIPLSSGGEEGSSYRKMIALSKQKPPDYYQKSIFQANNGKKDLLKLPSRFPMHPKETKEYKFRRVLQTFSDESWRYVIHRDEPAVTSLLNSAKRFLEEYEVIPTQSTPSVFF